MRAFLNECVQLIADSCSRKAPVNALQQPLFFVSTHQGNRLAVEHLQALLKSFFVVILPLNQILPCNLKRRKSSKDTRERVLATGRRIILLYIAVLYILLLKYCQVSGLIN